MISLYESIQGIKRLSPEEREKLMKLDKLYGEYCQLDRDLRDHKTVTNVDEEMEKFFKYRGMGQKYFPQLKCPGVKYDSSLVEMGKNLRKEFNEFPCFLSKYYVEILDHIIKNQEFFLGLRTVNWYTTTNAQKPSMENFHLALQTIRENPYQESSSVKNIDSKKATEMIKSHIDKMGYGWKVSLKDNMLPRMSVNPDCTMYIKKKAKFSKIDIDGLCAHEVDGHIGRRYYGLKTGLCLFQYGLFARNVLDEGLAIYNSLHKVTTPKPNILFNIALKTVIVYMLQDHDFCEVFDYCRALDEGMPDKELFKSIIRLKRELGDSSIMGCCGDDQSYFCGYQIVKKMDDEMRDDILKYNIGPNQIPELPDIKKFLELNKFESLI